MSSSSKEKKHRSSSKEKSEKSTKEHVSSKSGEKLGSAMRKVLALVVSKPKHYTKRRIVSKLREEYGNKVVHGAIDSLQEKDKIGTHHIPGKGKEKGFYTLIPLSKAA